MQTNFARPSRFFLHFLPLLLSEKAQFHVLRKKEKTKRLPAVYRNECMYPYVMYSYVPVCIRVLLVCYPSAPVWCFSQDLK